MRGPLQGLVREGARAREEGRSPRKVRWMTPARRAALLGSSRMLFEAALKRLRAGELEPPKASLGFSFERAVIRRVHEFLEARAGGVVREAWAGVRVARIGSPTDADAELDVVLVLCNGILVHLECKTWKVERKDLQSRVLGLRAAGSSLARMVLCSPLPTDFHAERWFPHYHHLRRRVREDWGMEHLALGLPGQPGTYPCPDQPDAAPLPSPEFEVELGRLLSRWEPVS